MTLRCVWSYLLCVVEGSSSARSRQVALAWFSFAGKSYNRDGISRAGAGSIEDALTKAEVQSEAVAWSLGFDPQEAFSVGFQGSFRTSPTVNSAYDLDGGTQEIGTSSLKLSDETLLANICCGPVKIAISGKRRFPYGARGGRDNSDTTVVPGLSAFRWRCIDFSGRMNVRGHSREIDGVAYFQQVRSHIPLLPWDWCYCAFPDGSIAGISTLRIGRDLIVSEKHVRSGRISSLDLPIFCRGFFVDSKTGRFFRMTRSKVVRSASKRNEQKKRILASDGQGRRMQFEVIIEDAHNFDFSRSTLRHPGCRFHYRSSTGAVRDFSFQNERDESDNRSFQTGVCNLERTYGIMT